MPTTNRHCGGLLLVGMACCRA